MIQTLRIIRRKSDDIWTIYVSEFFKLIGFVVTDHIIEKNNSNLLKEYDVNVLLNYSETDLKFTEIYDTLKVNNNDKEEKIIIIAKTPIAEDDISFEKLKELGEKFLWHDIVSKIEVLNDSSIKYLVYAYCKYNLFFYSYIRINLKFAVEYYSLNVKNNSHKDIRKKAYEKSFFAFAGAYNLLMKFDEETEILNQYYKFSIINFRYIINYFMFVLEKRSVFNREKMLDSANKLRKEFSEWICISYLCAKIYDSEAAKRPDISICYNMTHNVAEKNYPSHEFAFYICEFGKFYKESLKEKVIAYEKLYPLALRHNDMYYKALYEVAKFDWGKKRYEECISKFNKIINVIFNKFSLNLIMPEEQIWGYKTFRDLGEVYYEMQIYDLAIRALEMALKISDTRSKLFYILNKKHELDCFEQVIKDSMPRQPIYLELISLATKMHDQRRIDKYNLKLKQLE